MGSFMDRVKAQAQAEQNEAGVQATATATMQNETKATATATATQSAKPKKSAWNKGVVVEDVNVDVLSEQGKEEYASKSFDEKMAFQLAKGFLDTNAPELKELLTAVDEKRPIVALSIGTTGLQLNRQQEAYDENGKSIGKRNPFLENAVTQVGIVVYKPNEQGKYEITEKFLGIPDDIRESAIAQVAIEEHHSKGKNYNMFLKKNPDSKITFAEFTEEGYNALRSGGFGVPVGEGGYGFEIENRSQSEYCMPLKAISDKINDLCGNGAFVVSNMEGISDWLTRNGMHIDADTVAFGKIAKQYIFTEGKENPFLDKNGKVIDKATIDGFVQGLGIDIPQYKAVDRASTIGLITTEIIDKVEANRMKEAENVIVSEAPVQEAPVQENVPEKGKAVQSRINDEQSPLEKVGALGDVGMSVATTKSEEKAEDRPYSDKVGIVANIVVDGNSFPSITEKKALLLAVDSRMANIADRIKDIIGHTIPVCESDYAFNDDGSVVIQVPFIVAPDEIDSVKAFIAEVTANPNSIKESIAFYGMYDKAQADRLDKIDIKSDTTLLLVDKVDEQFVVVEPVRDKWFETTQKGVDEILSLVYQTKEIPSVTIEDAKRMSNERKGITPEVKTEETVTETKAETVQEEAKQNEAKEPTPEQVEQQKKEVEAEKEIQKQNFDTVKEVAGITTAVSMLINAVQEPIIKKVDELSKLVVELTAMNEQQSKQIEALTAINKEQLTKLADLTSQNKVLESKLESAVHLIDDSTKAQQQILSKQIELSTQLQKKEQDKSVEKKTVPNGGIGGNRS